MSTLQDSFPTFLCACPAWLAPHWPDTTALHPRLPQMCSDARSYEVKAALQIQRDPASNVMAEGGKVAGSAPNFRLGVLPIFNSSVPPLTISACLNQTC